MSKPDDRRDNAAKIKHHIESTRENMEAAKEVIAATSDPKAKADLMAKNQRRAQAIPDMVREMKEESDNQHRS